LELFQLLLSGLASGCVYGLIALGFVLIYKATEAINFAQGDMMMFGAFITIWLTNSGYNNLPLLFSVPLMILIMGAFGFLIERIFLRQVIGQSQIAIAILTIALGFVLRFIAGAIWGHEPHFLESPMVGKNIYLNGAVLGLAEIFVILVTILLTVLLYFFFAKTKLGIAMVAASQNQLAAFYVGIPVKRVQSLTWVIAGILAGIAGMLFSAKGSVDPITGLLGIKAFAAAVIGGFGSLPGALIGGLIIGLIEPFSGRYLPSGFSHLVPYIVLVLVLILRPHGLFSQISHKKV